MFRGSFARRRASTLLSSSVGVPGATRGVVFGRGDLDASLGRCERRGHFGAALACPPRRVSGPGASPPGCPWAWRCNGGASARCALGRFSSSGFASQHGFSCGGCRCWCHLRVVCVCIVAWRFSRSCGSVFARCCVCRSHAFRRWWRLVGVARALGLWFGSGVVRSAGAPPPRAGVDAFVLRCAQRGRGVRVSLCERGSRRPARAL